MHACAVRTSALAAVGSEPFSVVRDLGEDFAFCERLRRHGFRIGCATHLSFAHVDSAFGLAFLPGDAPFVIGESGLRPAGPDDVRGIPGVAVDVRSARARPGIRVVAFPSAPRQYGPRVNAALDTSPPAERLVRVFDVTAPAQVPA